MDIKYIVVNNDDKKFVKAIAYNLDYEYYVVTNEKCEAIAKCAPEDFDLFNEETGKIIARKRLLVKYYSILEKYYKDLYEVGQKQLKQIRNKMKFCSNKVENADYWLYERDLD